MGLLHVTFDKAIRTTSKAIYVRIQPGERPYPNCPNSTGITDIFGLGKDSFTSQILIPWELLKQAALSCHMETLNGEMVSKLSGSHNHFTFGILHTDIYIPF